MASTEDRMRENRRVLAEITKSERTVTRLLHGMPEAAHELRNEIDALANTARQMHSALNRAWWVPLRRSTLEMPGPPLAGDHDPADGESRQSPRDGARPRSGGGRCR